MRPWKQMKTHHASCRVPRLGLPSSPSPFRPRSPIHRPSPIICRASASCSPHSLSPLTSFTPSYRRQETVDSGLETSVFDRRGCPVLDITSNPSIHFHDTPLHHPDPLWFTSDHQLHSDPSNRLDRHAFRIDPLSRGFDVSPRVPSGSLVLSGSRGWGVSSRLRGMVGRDDPPGSRCSSFILFILSLTNSLLFFPSFAFISSSFPTFLGAYTPPSTPYMRIY
jgi:hypothetical protein